VKKDEKKQIAEALGASRVVDLDQKKIRSPLDMLALRRDFDSRLRSSGGRPTDPAWTVSRQVPFKSESWTRLKDLASEVGLEGPRVGPAQVAALLIENSLEQLEEEHWQEVLKRSRQISLRSQPEAADLARVTYNQFDDWVQRGWIAPARRRGHQRSFSADEIIRAIWLRSVAVSADDVASVASGVRDSDLSARYLVVTNASDVLAVPTRTQLYRLLETAGSHLVIDQLPERRKLLGQLSSAGEPHEDPIQNVI
jgi:DNA-binding transcriptional MerR regulator